LVGDDDGFVVGDRVGCFVGKRVGALVGDLMGEAVGGLGAGGAGGDGVGGGGVGGLGVGRANPTNPPLLNKLPKLFGRVGVPVNPSEPRKFDPDDEPPEKKLEKSNPLKLLLVVELKKSGVLLP
jgi:hypothetical protein